MAQHQPSRAPESALDQRAHTIASRQRGYITRSQALEAGLTSRQLQQRAGRGGWTRVLPGVFRLPGTSESWEGRVQAVVLWAGPQALLCGRTAAHLLGLDGIERPDMIDVLTNVSTKARGVRAHRLGSDDNARRRFARGFPICEIERVLIQLAADLPARPVGKALDSALRESLTTIDRMKDAIGESSPGRPGVGLMRRLLSGRDTDDEKIRSAFEAKMLRILRRIRGLHFIADHHITISGENFVLDFFVPAGDLAIECHSFRYHMGRHNEDVRRERKIRSTGMDVISFTWDDVTFDPEATQRDLRQRLSLLGVELP